MFSENFKSSVSVSLDRHFTMKIWELEAKCKKHLRVNLCTHVLVLKKWSYHCQMLVWDAFIPVSFSVFVFFAIKCFISFNLILPSHDISFSLNPEQPSGTWKVSFKRLHRAFKCLLRACYLWMRFWSWCILYFRSVFLLSLQCVRPGIFKQDSVLNVEFLKNIESSHHTL